MIISNSRKFIFVHVNKTAGTSIAEALYPSLAWNDIVLGTTPIGAALDQPFQERFGLYKHSTAPEIRAVVGAGIWADYRSFAVLRDPVDRAVSFYGYLKRFQRGKSGVRHRLRRLLGRSRPESRPEWPGLQALRETGSFSEFIRHPRLPDDPGFAFQHAFISDRETGEIIVDTVLRFETVAADFAGLCRDLGIADASLGHENHSHDQRRNQPAISQSDIAFLKAYFARDYALLAKLDAGPQKAGALRASAG